LKVVINSCNPAQLIIKRSLNTKGSCSGAGTAYPSGTTEVTHSWFLVGFM
jgi:hypothetical protein